MKSYSESYKDSGVDITAGYKAVELMKKHIARTTNAGCLSGIGGFGTAQAIQWGLRRGAFSNEAGLGSSAIAHGSAAARSPGEQGLWGIFEVFADTIVICTATALTILCSGVGIPWGSSPGAELLLSAWETCIPAAPAACFMALSLLLFAFTSVLGWASGFYGVKKQPHRIGCASRWR